MRMSYDAEFVEKMREKLVKEKKSLENDLARFARPVGEEGEYETIQENLGSDMDDSATETEINDNNKSLERSLEAKLKDVLDALEKIEVGTYGVCEKTGRDIPKDRLEVLPMARVCADV
jgi:RNA polymerase-binding transcription factor DksA